MSHALEQALTDDNRRRQLVDRFSQMHESLTADTANLAADVIMSVARH